MSGTLSPPPGELLWSADIEEGSLADWYQPERDARGDFGGTEENSGSGDTTVSKEQAHSGEHGMKMVLGNGEGGTRMFRWRELRSQRETVVSVWIYMPRSYALTADRSTGGFFNLFQFKSRSQDGTRNDPFWFLDAQRRGEGDVIPQLVWWQKKLEGPSWGESGFRRFTEPNARLPLGRWFEIKAYLRQSHDFDGILRVWLDGQLLFDMQDVRTGFANCDFNAWCVAQDWSVNLYSDGLLPAPSVIYADDARIERALPVPDLPDSGSGQHAAPAAGQAPPATGQEAARCPPDVGAAGSCSVSSPLNRTQGRRPFQSLALARRFRPVLSRVKRRTRVPILLPSRAPAPIDRRGLLARGTGNAKGYRLVLMRRRGCRNRTGCFLGAFRARRGGRPSVKGSVRLSRGLRGYLSVNGCGASCALIQWRQRGVLYEIAYRSAAPDERSPLMVGLANSAIRAGPR